MSPLRIALTEYLALRRALGLKLQTAELILRQFVSFAEREEALWITTDLARRWATQPQGVQPAHWATRLGMVRGFAQYCRALDPQTEVPPHGLLPYRYRRQPPSIYSEQEIVALLTATRQLASVTGLRPATYATLLGLLAVTGLRLSEALHLERTDVEVTYGHLPIRQSKFGKSRCIPLHPSTREALAHYARVRDQLWPRPPTLRFFRSEQGTPLSKWSVQRTFVRLSHHLGLRGMTDRSGPRLHDFRHSFAVRTLLHWYRTGADVEQRMPTLSAYLGHAHVNDTFWYLSATPELFREVTRHLDTCSRLRTSERMLENSASLDSHYVRISRSFGLNSLRICSHYVRTA